MADSFVLVHFDMDQDPNVPHEDRGSTQAEVC
jgi:hypothetical protein